VTAGKKASDSANGDQLGADDLCLRPMLGGNPLPKFFQ
jgi:hypothetical protein